MTEGHKFDLFVFDLSHLGNLSPKDNTTLVDALKDMQAKGLL
jgi:hypothetical protein